MRNSRFMLAMCMSAAAILRSGLVLADPPKATTPAMTATPEIARGKRVYDQWCLGCHAPLPGVGRFPPAGTYRLQQRYHGRLPATLEERSDLTPQFIRLVVRRGMTIMPPTRKTEVTDTELEAVIAYLTQKKLK